jgi:hypothetical protein
VRELKDVTLNVCAAVIGLDLKDYEQEEAVLTVLYFHISHGYVAKLLIISTSRSI